MENIMTTFLSEVQLNNLVPSVFATGGAEHTSQKYGFIPTIEVVRGLRDSGFHPVTAFQSKSRIEGRKNFVKHVMRFRHETAVEKGGVLPEIVLVNSHDGSTSYQLRAGVYRLVCSNGMIVGDEIFCRRVKHQGDVIRHVVEAAHDLIEIVPLSVEKALDWQSVQLSLAEKHAFAQAAMQLKWDQDETPVSSAQILQPRRLADDKSDLWTTFNTVQENLIKGNLRYRTESGTRVRTRGVNSVTENVKLNTALWTLTEKMAQLKS